MPRLLRDGKPVALAPTPFAVLCALARQPGSLLTKHALLDEVWGHQFVSDSVLKTAISDLRTALDDDARQPRFIETVSRRGYRFIAATTAIARRDRRRARALRRTARRRLPSFIGRAEALSRLRSAWDTCVQRQARGCLGCRRTGHRQDHADRAFRRGPRRRRLCARPMRGALRHRRAVSSCAGSARGAVPQRQRACPSLLRAVAPTWLLQLPWLSTAEERDALRRELAGVGPDRMLREMGELLDRYTEHRPLLLVTEDLHWSDRATIQLIDYVARRRGSARLMWLASFRLAEVVALDHPLNPLRHELRLHGLCEEIVLDPFSETEVADYVAATVTVARARRGVRARACTSARTGCRCSWHQS